MLVTRALRGQQTETLSSATAHVHVHAHACGKAAHLHLFYELWADGHGDREGVAGDPPRALQLVLVLYAGFGNRSHEARLVGVLADPGEEGAPGYCVRYRALPGYQRLQGSSSLTPLFHCGSTAQLPPMHSTPFHSLDAEPGWTLSSSRQKILLVSEIPSLMRTH